MAPRRATKGSVGYDFYSTEFKSISLQECDSTIYFDKIRELRGCGGYRS